MFMVRCWFWAKILLLFVTPAIFYSCSCGCERKFTWNKHYNLKVANLYSTGRERNFRFLERFEFRALFPSKIVGKWIFRDAFHHSKALGNGYFVMVFNLFWFFAHFFREMAIVWIIIQNFKFQRVMQLLCGLFKQNGVFPLWVIWNWNENSCQMKFSTRASHSC